MVAVTDRLAAADLTVGFGDLTILRGIDLAVGPSEVVALQGPSGSGKSSLLRALGGLLVPAAGSVHLGDASLYGLSPHERDRLRRERFGFVFQFGELIDELTLLENVALPLRLQRVRRRRADALAQDRLDRLGIGRLGSRRPHEVSGGQLQRAAIARAVVHEPAVVLADEPTGALDDDIAGVVFDVLVAQASATGAAVLVATHDQELAARADRRLVIERGALRLAA